MMPGLSQSASSPRYANSGGPSSRTRSERVQASLLGQNDGPVRCRRRKALGLDFGDEDPVTTMESLLNIAGYSCPEELRTLFGRNLGSMLCHPSPGIRPLPVRGTEPRKVLEQALLLGLCTAVLFDPSRPVLWTQSSLTRRLELFDMSEFFS